MSASVEKYPEHQKLQALKKESQAIGEFVNWLLNTKNFRLAQWLPDDEQDEDSDDTLVQVWPNIEQLLAEYFQIDLGKLEQEKQAMLDEVRFAAWRKKK